MTIRRPIIISAVLIPAMACLSLAAAIVLPGTVPLRFNAHGVPTSYGSPSLPLALMPLAALVLSAIFVALARGEPRRQNLVHSMLAYATRWIGAIAILALVHIWIVYTLITSARGALPLDPTRLVFALAGAMIAVVGSQLNKVRSNFMIGVRTPWTLANDQVWERTHRLARWPVILSGLVILTAALAAPSSSILLTLTLTVVIVVAAGLILMSYVLWRGSDERRMGA
jgi:uncharacterized membrane protein